MEDSSSDTFGIVFMVLIYGLPILFAICGFLIGTFLERRHFESIRLREKEFARIPIFPTQGTDPAKNVAEGALVVASIVVSLDYFKRILASFRNIFGGNVRSYESLLDRAKREAILRLKEQAPDCDAIINLRLETATLASTQSKKKGTGGVEVIAYGTAIHYR